MSIDEQSQRLTQFVIGNQQYKIYRLFFGIFIGLAALPAFIVMIKKNRIFFSPL